MAYLKVLSQDLPGTTVEHHENSVKIASLQAEILIWDLPGTKLKCYPLFHNVQ
jgi:hypothetical protein